MRTYISPRRLGVVLVQVAISVNSVGAAPVGTSGCTPQPDGCGSPSAQLAQGDHRIVDPSGRAEIPFQMSGHHVLVPVSVNDGEPFLVVLDTGMPIRGLILTPGPRTDALELENPHGLRVAGEGSDSRDSRVGTGVTLTLPGVQISDQLVAVTSLPACGGNDGQDHPNDPRVEGVIGLSIFERFVVRIDHDRSLVTLVEPDQFRHDGRGHEIPITLGPTNIPEINCEVEIDPGERVPVTIAVDTGAALALSLTLGTHEDLRLPAGSHDSVTAYSAWGEVEGRLGTIAALRLGKLTLPDIPVAFYRKGDPGIPPCGEHGILGNATLRRFNTTFDYVRKRLILEPKQRSHEPVTVPVGNLRSSTTDTAVPDSTDELSDSQELVEEVAAFVQRQADEGKFSGAVLVAKQGVPVFEAAHGFASLDYEVPNRIDTKFNLGSMNKMFTSVAIAQLAELGRLSFDDRIVDHLPDYPNVEVARQVTIHHLLSHTSGLGNYWSEEYERTSKDRFRSVEDYLPLFVDQPLLFEPGARWSYSNAGFIVLGLIIERVSGQSYFDYVRENIYEPAGMTNTDAYEVDHVIRNVAVGYTRSGEREGELKNNLFMHVVKGGPAGGGYSTVEDLLSFSNALLDHRLVSQEMTDRIFAGRSDTTRVGPGYGYGFSRLLENGHLIVGHSGGFPGINAHLDMYVDLDYTVVVMSNLDRGATEVEEFILVQLIGKTQWIKDRELTETILERIAERGYHAGIQLYEERKGVGTVSERRVNQFGYSLLTANRIPDAIGVFRFNVHLHPESSNAYDSLGEAYMMANEIELAVRNYERSVALDPGNTNGWNMLEKLRGESSP